MSEPTNPNADMEETRRQPLVSGGDRDVQRSTSASDDPWSKPATKSSGSKTPGAGATVATAATRGVKTTDATDPKATTDVKGSRVKPTRTRRARLRISRIDPWSAMKTSFLFAIAGGIIFWVFTYFVWAAIGSSGLFDSINSMVGDIVNAQGQAQFQIQRYISTNKVLGFAAILAFVDVILLTILGTLGSFLYNLSATMLGGLEITLAED